MSMRARFFDDYRLSRIIEEDSDRFSLHSDISCSTDAVSTTQSASFVSQRSASADGTLQSTADDDDYEDDYELPPPPPQLTSIDLHQSAMKPPELPAKRQNIDYGATTLIGDCELSAAAARALQFMQAKYDSLGKVKVDKPSPLQATSGRQAESLQPKGNEDSGTKQKASEICYILKQEDFIPGMHRGADGCSSHVTDMQSDCGEHIGATAAVSDRSVAGHSMSRTGGVDVNINDGCCPDKHHHRPLQQQGLSDHRHHLQQQQQHFASHLPNHGSSPRSCDVAGRCSPTSSRRSSPLTTAELFQVDLFYRSHKTVVHVSTCVATLYFADVCVSGSRQRGHPPTPQQHALANADWKPATLGIPVVMFDQRRSRLYVVLAERGTGFELWRHTIDRTDQYYAVCIDDEPAFHVISLTTNGGETTSRGGGTSTSRMAGLHFDDTLAATEFHRQLLRLADYDRTLATGIKSKNNKAGKSGAKKSMGRPASFSKADISQPCCFTHVTRLERDTSNNTLVNSAKTNRRR